MSQTAVAPTHPSLHANEWPEIELPPTDLPYDDGEPMESPWHRDAGELLRLGYIAARGGRREDYYVGVNMFVYFSTEQVRNQDFKGPDVFIVKDVDGTKHRNSWIAWEENSRLPDVIIEFLSPSTEDNDLGDKKQLYERTFRTREYFCIAPEVERLLGWRLARTGYVPIEPDARGWLWSEELGLWLGPWQGVYVEEEHTWPRFYTPDGALVPLPVEAQAQRADHAEQRTEEERQRAEQAEQQAEQERQRAEQAEQQAAAERQRAEEERQRAADLAARLAALEAAMNRSQSETGDTQ